MKEIESKTNFTFVYRDILMDTKKDISIQVGNKPLADVIQTVLDSKELEATFRVIKDDLEVRPLFRWKLRKITAYIIARDL